MNFAFVTQTRASHAVGCFIDQRHCMALALQRQRYAHALEPGAKDNYVFSRHKRFRVALHRVNIEKHRRGGASHLIDALPLHTCPILVKGMYEGNGASMSPPGSDHSDFEPGPKPSRSIFTPRASRAERMALSVRPCSRAMRFTTVAGIWPAGQCLL